MKQKIFFLLMIICAMSFWSCDSDNNDPSIDESEINVLPEAAKAFITTYFNQYTVNEVVKNETENEKGSIYVSQLQKNGNVTGMASNVKIEFDQNGDWTEIESFTDGIPIPDEIMKMLPIAIEQYINLNYPGIGIEEIEKKAYGYKVELINGKELLFDKNGDILNDVQTGQGPETGDGTTNSIENFISAHFPDYSIAYTKNDYENGVLYKKVYLKNGYKKSYKIVFDSDENWIEVEGDDDIYLPVPESIMQLLPESISIYIKDKYASTYITEVKKRKTGFEIELANDIELYFNMNGDLISSDHEDKSNNDDNVNVGNLPESITSFLATHFPGILCREIEQKKKPDSDGKMYEVELVNGVEIDFDQNGNWLSIDGDDKPLPQSFIDTLPFGIFSYITANYQNVYISEVEIERNQYKVEIIINNKKDIELCFDLAGNFLYIDD